MPFIADLHVHSKYSRATSRDMCPEGLWRAAQLKGIRVIATGDFTHPAWIRELQDKLEPAEQGLYALKRKLRTADVPATCAAEVSFVLSAEISCIYRKNDRTRKVHAVVLMPDIAAALRLNKALEKIGNVRSDGRPILGLDAKELLRMTLDASPDGLFIPAHAWTPWFSVFGAMSGFDSLEECFDELTPQIHAIETGLSSDPAMNWRLSALDRITLVSNSDAHSAAKIGREANVFDASISYDAMLRAIKTKQGFGGTIEFFPEEGKYHFDGHRDCKVSLTPRETERGNFRCPVCGKNVTVGVMHRVEKLADRQEGFRPKNAPGYRSIIPLAEVIAEAFGAGVNTKKVQTAYVRVLEELGNEFSVLLDADPKALGAVSIPEIGEAVALMRAGKVRITPGYDGEYGKIRIFERPARAKGRPAGKAKDR